MVNLLISSPQTNVFVLVFWALAAAVVFLFFIAIFVQRKKGKHLAEELKELDKIKQSNTEFEFVLKAMKIAVWRYDARDQSFAYENDFREGMNNYVISDNEKFQDTLSTINPADVERVSQSFGDILEGRTDFYHEEYRVNNKAGGTSYWEESFATIVERDENGKPMKIVGTSQRIDERKEMESSLVTARNKAEESDRLKTAFLANMGHEIRTPLNAIVGFADLLPVVESEEDRNQLIQEIQNNNHKLLRIIDGLVSMAKIEAGAKSLLMAKVDVNNMLQQMVDTYQPTTMLAIMTECPLEELPIQTDREKLFEILDNLVQNAVKFTEAGSVTLGYDVLGDRLRIWVKDTGKGIPEADQERIFERFVKLDEYVPGTGLGLSVAKSHALSLNGSIGVESKVGEGSTFWVELPLS
jgi:signal transduction histidine kinase